MLHAERDEFIQWYNNLTSDYVFHFKIELEQYSIQMSIYCAWHVQGSGSL